MFILPEIQVPPPPGHYHISYVILHDMCLSCLKYKCRPPPGHYHISYVILHDSLHDNPTQQFLHCIRGHRYTRRLILRPISAARPRTDTCTKNPPRGQTEALYCCPLKKTLIIYFTVCIFIICLQLQKGH